MKPYSFLTKASAALLIFFLSGNYSFGQCWKQIEAGQMHTLGIKADGTLWAWGNNSSGQMGDGTTISKFVPTRIGTDNNWSSVATGRSHSLAIKTNGTLWAWGNNYSGQVGNGTNDNVIIPVQIGTETNWSQVSTWETHSLGLKTNGTVWAWGIIIGDN